MMEWLNRMRAGWLVAGSRHRAALQEMPERVNRYWQLNASKEFEGIPRDAFFYARASEGLMDFFKCVELAEGKPCGLPSRAADSVWHAWIKADPHGLGQFTLRHFKRRIPHVEAHAMADGMGEALARSLVICRGISRMYPEGPGVPGLFALDRELRMPLGFGYQMHRKEIGYSILDSRGRAGASMVFPPALAAAGLLAAHLITQQQYEAALSRRDDAGGGCGSGGSSSGSDGGCDGGGDGGGCGGGCGGGD